MFKLPPLLLGVSAAALLASAAMAKRRSDLSIMLNEGVTFHDGSTMDTEDVELSEANGNMLFNLARGDGVIVAPESIEGVKQTPIGTGAFKFDSLTQGGKIELSRNDNYWGTPSILINATFKCISDPTAALGAMMVEDVDVFSSFPAPENLPQFEADPRFQAFVGSTEGETILSTNNKMPPFDNVKVHEALGRSRIFRRV